MNAPLPITEALEAIARALDGGPAVVVVTNIGGVGMPGERLLLDAIQGDAALFTRAAAVVIARSEGAEVLGPLQPTMAEQG